jgi:cytochrome c oxidase subunit 3
MTVAALHPAAFAGRRRTSFVGTALMLGSWAMLFASLFFAYAVVRYHAAAWPPEGATPLPRALPFVNTLVLLASSVLLARGARRPAMALGAGFLGLQFAVWIPLWRAGFTLASGIYGSVFYALTAFHALHVLAGLGALALTARAEGRRAAAMFWHFVDAVWVVMFVAVYLL